MAEEEEEVMPEATDAEDREPRTLADSAPEEGYTSERGGGETEVDDAYTSPTTYGPGETEEEEETEEYNEKKEKKKQLMREYMALMLEIEAQNKIVEELKDKIYEKCQKGCLTKCEEMEVRNLRCCLEKENLKLKCLLRKAVCLQEEDPTEQWEAIPIATTFGEDNMPSGLNYNIMKSICKKSFSDDECCRQMQKSKECPREEGSDSKTELEKFICCLLQKAKKEKGIKRPKCEMGCPDDTTMLELDDETIQKILCAVQNQNTCNREKKDRCNKKNKKNMSSVCKELNRSYSMQERLVQDNADLEGDRFKLQEELLCRDRMIECLQKKMQVMQCELQKLCREKQKIMKDTCKNGGEISPKTQNRLHKYKQCAKALQKNINNMQCSVERIKIEMDGLKKERNRWEECQQQMSNDTIGLCGKRKSKQDEIEDLKKNYTNLLQDYCRKDSELKELQQRTKGFVDQCEERNGHGKDSIDSAELELYKNKVHDLQDEQEEFKCLIKEQSEQLDDYRNKYMIAQQKVEEQKCIIEKLEMNNKRIEEQINLEIQRIKTKFQEKLKELSQLPKLLENEQLKLAAVCKEKEDLEQKLRLVCKELKALKTQLSNMSDGADAAELAAKLRQLEHDMALLQKKYEDALADKELICEKLEKTQDELDTLRTESARIIARTKERAESQRETLQCRIDKLEKELAQCRATACLSISDREDVIKEMKGQLSTLSYSFDSAQKQIKTLKNHISFLANENSYPVKC